MSRTTGDGGGEEEEMEEEKDVLNKLCVSRCYKKRTEDLLGDMIILLAISMQKRRVALYSDTPC